MYVAGYCSCPMWSSAGLDIVFLKSLVKTYVLNDFRVTYVAAIRSGDRDPILNRPEGVPRSPSKR